MERFGDRSNAEILAAYPYPTSVRTVQLAMAAIVDQPREKRLREQAEEQRSPNYDISPLLVERWSPRAMTGEPLTEDEFLPLFEAARWAPSSFNNQHWRFLYTTPEDEAWGAFVDLLSEGNSRWATDAGLLVVIVSKTTFDHNDEDARTHSFDTGAAWENLALEGIRRGLVVHGMEGFDYDQAAEELNIPDQHEVEAMCAIGKPAAEEVLSDELQAREEPTGRKQLDEIVYEGGFDADN